MQLSRVRDYFAAGAILSATVSHYPVRESWCVDFTFRPGTHPGGESSLDTQRGQLRDFKTVDAAIKLLRDIGFTDATVRFR